MVPSDSAAKFSIPTSIPTESSDAGNGTGVYSKVSVANHPDTERLIEQVLTKASSGSGRLRCNLMLPTFETLRYFPLSENPVLLNWKLSYLSLPLKRGKPGAPPVLQRRKKFWNERSSFLNTFLST